MKKIIKSLSALLLVLILMMATLAINVSAAEGELVVDGKLAYKVGDTITYDLRLQTSVPVVGVQMVIKYDKEYLKIDTESVESPKLLASVKNPYLEDRIILVWSDYTGASDFRQESTLLKVDFEVIKEGKTNITYVIQEMYSRDLTYLKEYTLTVDYSENGNVVEEGDTPIVETDPDFLDENQGDFPNYADGKGEENTDVDDNRTVVTSPNKVNEPAADNNNNNGGSSNNNGNNSNQYVSPQATDANGNIIATNAQGEALATNADGNYLDENGDVLSTDADGNYVDKNGSIYQENTQTQQPNKPIDIVPIIVIIAIVLAALAIVVIIVLKSRGGNGDSKIISQSPQVNASSNNEEISEDSE